MRMFRFGLSVLSTPHLLAMFLGRGSDNGYVIFAGAACASARISHLPGARIW